MKAYVIMGLGFGDEGKGSITDYYVRQCNAHTVIRFNGGAQAAHRVVTPDGRDHVFSQFGSGTFIPDVRTLLSRFMLFDPPAMAKEAAHLTEIGVTDAMDRLYVADQCPVITPFHKAANRIREASRSQGHGSCGMGIGELMMDIQAKRPVIHAGDLLYPHTIRQMAQIIQTQKRTEMQPLLDLLPHNRQSNEYGILYDPGVVERWAADVEANVHNYHIININEQDGFYDDGGNMVFEGAQGILLDEWKGFHPYTSWSTATADNALALLDEHMCMCDVVKVGVTRAYHTRHGPGPFPTENAELTARLPDTHNTTNRWQREFRVGWLDTILLDYAIKATGGIDELAVTNLDRLPCRSHVCDGYDPPADSIRPSFTRDLGRQEAIGRFLTGAMPCLRPVDNVLEYLHEKMGLNIAVASRGPTYLDKQINPLAIRSEHGQLA